MHLWARGLVAAIINGAAGGGSTALSASIVSPEHFNTAEPALLVKMTLVSIVVSAFIGVFNYLKQSPLPPE